MTILQNCLVAAMLSRCFLSILLDSPKANWFSWKSYDADVEQGLSPDGISWSLNLVPCRFCQGFSISEWQWKIHCLPSVRPFLKQGH